MSYYLPNESYKYQLSLYSNFNNELIRGHNQGLELYNYNTDLNLYKNIDTKPIDSVNFNDINDRLKTNENLYNNTKSTLSGALSGLLEGTGKGLNEFTSNLFGIDSAGIKTYIGLLLLFLIIIKKL
jgi:hypothetical protein